MCCGGCAGASAAAASMQPLMATAVGWNVTTIPSPTGQGTVPVPVYTPQPLAGQTIIAQRDAWPWWLLLAAGVAGVLFITGGKR